MNEKKKQSQLTRFIKVLTIVFFLFFGAFSAYYQIKYFPTMGWLYFIYPLIALFVSIPLHVLLHEIGHLLAGFLSGYQFLMFRLGRNVWIKTPAGLSKRQQYIPGILGQALMAPPVAQDNEQVPVLFYHLGGLIMNALTSGLFIWFAQQSSNLLLSYFLYLSAFTAVYLLITNALPFKGSDGYNIQRSLRNADSQDEVMKLLIIYRDMVAGVPFSNLAQAIDLTHYQDFNDPNTATFHSVHGAAYLEKLAFQKARMIYEPFWEKREQLFAGHQMDMIMNYYFTLLLTEPEHPAIFNIQKTPSYQTFTKLKQVDSYRVLATEALLLEKDRPKAQSLLKLGVQEIPVAPTVSDEQLEAILYDYLQAELARQIDQTNP